MRRRERAAFLSPRRNKGVALSGQYRLSLEDSFRNTLLVAPSGGGKTTRFVIPSILLARDCSLVITDPSGEVFRHTSGHLAGQGYKVEVIRPTDPDESARFNPVLRFRDSHGLRRLATILAKHSGNERTDVFWTTMAGNLLFICLTALAGVGNDRCLTLGNVRHMVNCLGTANRDMHAFVARHLEDESLFAEYRATMAQDERLLANVLSSARAAVDMWSDPAVVRLTSAHTLDIAQIRQRKTAIFVIVPEHRIREFGALLGLIYSALFDYCLEHPAGLPVFYYLDEFGNLGGPIANFGAVATTLRKRSCSLNLILQSTAQLTSLYGPNEAKTILSGAISNRLFFAGCDMETCEQVERWLGATTAYDAPPDVALEHGRQVGKPLMHAAEIRTMPSHAAILISSRQHPVRLHIPPFYRIPRLNRLGQKKPATLAFDYSQEQVTSFGSLIGGEVSPSSSSSEALVEGE